VFADSPSGVHPPCECLFARLPTAMTVLRQNYPKSEVRQQPSGASSCAISLRVESVSDWTTVVVVSCPWWGARAAAHRHVL